MNIPSALVLGCNDPVTVGVLFDWILDNCEFEVNFWESGWSLGGQRYEGFYGHGYGYGYSDGNGLGHGAGYSLLSTGCGTPTVNIHSEGGICGYFNGNGDGRGYGTINGDGRGYGDGSGYSL